MTLAFPSAMQTTGSVVFDNIHKSKPFQFTQEISTRLPPLHRVPFPRLPGARCAGAPVSIRHAEKLVRKHDDRLIVRRSNILAEPETTGRRATAV